MTKNKLIVVGSSHKTTPLEKLRCLSLPPEDVSECLPKLKQEGDLDEVVLLSTCNRTEIYAATNCPGSSSKFLKDWLFELGREESRLNEDNLYVFQHRDAARHLCCTACGLNSLIVGETEITGQVQTAYELSMERDCADSFMTQLFSTAFRCSKRARSETAINGGTTSVASASVHLTRRVFGDLKKRSILVIGAGETGCLVCRYIAPHRPGRLIIANRTISKAEEIARQVGGEAISLDKIDGLLGELDTVIAATYSKKPLITGSMVRKTRKHCRDRILLLIDISLPPNIEKEAQNQENVFLNDMNDLHAIVRRNLGRREKEMFRVTKIVDEEVRDFYLKQSTLQVGPFIKELRDHYETLRRSELDRFSSKLDETAKPIAERLTRDLVNKLLHWPTLGIRELAKDSEIEQERLAWSRSLFGLDRVRENTDRK